MAQVVEEWHATRCRASSPQHPLELILARNLLTSIATPAFLVSSDGAMLFYNEGAGALLGVPFEETGRMDPDDVDQLLRPLRRATASRCRWSSST